MERQTGPRTGRNPDRQAAANGTGSDNETTNRKNNASAGQDVLDRMHSHPAQHLEQEERDPVPPWASYFR